MKLKALFSLKNKRKFRRSPATVVIGSLRVKTSIKSNQHSNFIYSFTDLFFLADDSYEMFVSSLLGHTYMIKLGIPLFKVLVLAHLPTVRAKHKCS